MTTNNSIVVIYAHPHSAQSKVNRTLRAAIENLPAVSIVDLYEEYPDFFINVQREQKLLVANQLIVFQHPFYWYSCPPLLKEWLDVVLERGFAYGEGGTALNGKDFLQVVTSGGTEAAYQRSGNNRFTLTELLRPFEATAALCGWNYHEPFLVQGVRFLSDTEIDLRAAQYRELLSAYLKDGRKALNSFNSSLPLSQGRKDFFV